MPGSRFFLYGVPEKCAFQISAPLQGWGSVVTGA